MLDHFLKVKKMLWTHDNGNFAARLLWSGVDVEEQREYALGDEKRSINRKMSAKYDQLFVNLFHEEKMIDVVLCCDVNYNWKWENLKSFLSFFAQLTHYFQKEKAHISACLSDHSLVWLHTPVGQKAFVERLSTMTNNVFPLYSSSLTQLLTEQSMITKRRLLIIVSDFLVYNEQERKLVDGLRERNEVRLVQLPTHSVISLPHDILSIKSLI